MGKAIPHAGNFGIDYGVYIGIIEKCIVGSTFLEDLPVEMSRSWTSRAS